MTKPPSRYAQKCSVCRKALRSPEQTKASMKHCPSPTCNWCAGCYAAKWTECRR